MKKTVAVLLFAVIVLSAAPERCAATEPFAVVSTQTFQFLRYPTGARNLALGWVGAADDSDPRNQYYNPALLSSVEGFGVSGGRANWIVDIEFDDYGAQAGNLLPDGYLNRFRAAAAVRYTVMTARSTVERTLYLPEGTGRILNPQERNLTFALAGGWNVDVFDISCGFAVKRITQDFSDTVIRGWAYDLGVAGHARFWRGSPVRLIPSIGFSVLNLGKEIEYEGRTADLPQEKRAGGALRVEVSNLDLAGREVPFVTVSGVADYVDSPHFMPDKAGVGMDIGLIGVVHFRLGYRDHLDDDLDGYSSRGFGLDWRVRKLRFTLDYAHYETTHLTYFTQDAEAYSGAVTFDF